MYSLIDIFDQAMNQERAVINVAKNMGLSVIRMGVKIQKFNDRIEILNTGKGGSYYKECSENEYYYFINSGWKIGCIRLCIHNCLHKLKLIENKIKTEVNTRKNDKHIKNLKNKRELALYKHAELQLKLKSILN
jgi:hypothetical protein|tara:strand:+ start:6793 stop:7194 length:402 start_codon:yes stop_codon:yes gene_type:complete